MKETIEEMKKITRAIVNALCAHAKVFEYEVFERIAEAFANTLELEGTKDVPENYVWSVLTKHTGTCAGSTFNSYLDNPRFMYSGVLLSMNWIEMKDVPEKVKIPGCTYYRTYVKDVGVIKACELKKLIDEGQGDSEVSVVISKATGEYEIQIARAEEERTNYVTLITGPTSGKQVVYTMHPGNPMESGKPDLTKIAPGAEFITTIQKAYKIGFRTAKYVTLTEGQMRGIAAARLGLGCRQYWADEEKSVQSIVDDIRKQFESAINKEEFVKKL